MADQFGVSFSPFGDQGNGQQAANRPTPVQQAIQTLSLKIPRVVGAGSLAPQALLNSPGGGNMGGPVDAAAMLEQIKRMLFGNQGGGVPQGQFGTNPPPGGRTGGPDSFALPEPGGYVPPQPPPYMPSPTPNPGAPPAPEPPPSLPPGVTPGGDDNTPKVKGPEEPTYTPPPVMPTFPRGPEPRDRRL